MSKMGSTRQVTNCDLFIHETGKGVGIGWECPGHWPGNRSNLSSDTRAILGKGWRTWGNPYYQTRVWWLVSFSLWVQLYTSAESWKPGVPRDGTIRLFFLSIPMVTWSMDYEHFVIMTNTFTSMLSIACHNLNEHHCFPYLYKWPIITLCIHQILYIGIKSYEYAMYSWCYR